MAAWRVAVASGLLAAAWLAAGRPAAAQAPDRETVVARLCVKTVTIEGTPRCYRHDWHPRLKQLARRTAGADAAAIDRDSGVEIPGVLLEFPDGSRRAVFHGCRPHSCPEAGAYFVLDVAGREMNIVWRGDGGVKYLGPDAASLRENGMYEWLEKTSGR